MNVSLSTELLSKIEHRIQSILANESAGNSHIREVVRRTGALPLALDSGGGLSLAPSGDIIVFFWDDSKIDVEQDPRLVNMALFQGSLKYPELEEIVPPRPADAAECPHCKGTGYPTELEGSGIENIVCYCGRMGWIPPGDDGGKLSLSTAETPSGDIK